MEVTLTLANSAHVFLIIAMLAAGFFAVYQGTDRRQSGLLLAIMLSAVVFEMSMVWGVSTHDSYASRQVLMGTLAFLFIPALSIHWIALMFGKVRPQTVPLSILYAAAASLAAFFALSPFSYLKNSIPKLYYPSFINPGPYHWLAVASFFVGAAYLLAVSIRWRQGLGDAEKNRLSYAVVGTLLLELFIATPLLLGYGFPIDPAWAIPLGLAIIPMAYSSLRFELSSAEAAAKQAFYYAIGIAGTGVFIILINAVNGYIVESIEGFPSWIIPFLSGAVVVGVAATVLQKIREVDHLKYEFITVLTHKLRTPLTAIKWVSGNFKTAAKTDDERHDVSIIEGATENLLELTNRLVTLAGTEGGNFSYNLAPTDLGKLAAEAIAAHKKDIDERQLTVAASLPEGQAVIPLDAERMRFALQIIIENAIKYSPKASMLAVTLAVLRGGATELSFKDAGIGIPKEELAHIFRKFYRGSDAKRMDTEGVGIGLHIAREIIGKNGGTLSAASEGKGKGSTFTISFPKR